MLRYKEYRLAKPDESISKQISHLIITQNGSIFHEVELNRIIEKKFNTELFYLVDDPDNIQHAAVIHLTRKRFGIKQYNIRPLYDIPYAGFIGEAIIDLNDFSVNCFESFCYAGFPYIKKHDDLNNTSFGETAMVDLTLNEDEIFNNVIASKRRNMIRKAINSGITVNAYFDSEGLNIFWPMLSELHKKLGYVKLTYDYYNELFQKFSSKKQAYILIAFKNEIPTSGVLILGNKNYMHYYKGASGENIKNEGQGELLQWEAIKISKNLGVLKYDLCNLNIEKLPEIYRFKTGISKEIYKYQNFSYSSLCYKLINRIIKYIW